MDFFALRKYEEVCTDGDEDYCPSILENGCLVPGAIADNDPLGREPGAALWPARYPLTTLEEIRKVSARALYQQRPQAATGNVFLRSWWRTYQEPPAEINLLDRTLVNMPSPSAPTTASRMWQQRKPCSTWVLRKTSSNTSRQFDHNPAGRSATLRAATELSIGADASSICRLSKSVVATVKTMSPQGITRDSQNTFG